MSRSPDIVIEADRRVANRVWVHTIATQNGDYIAHYRTLSGLLRHLAAHDICRVLIAAEDAEYIVTIEAVNTKD